MMQSSTATFVVIFALTVATAIASEGLQIETIKEGDCSRKAKKGDSLKMHYAGTLMDGKEFDSSYNRGSPFAFTLGAGMVIAGWDQGLEGICKGEVRNLVIPSDMAYGDSGYPPIIPAKATLKFKVELVEFGNAAANDDEEDEDEEL